MLYPTAQAEIGLTSNPYGQVLSSKTWDISFSHPVNVESIEGNIEILDLKTNTTVPFIYSMKSKNRTITISSTSFEIEHSYRLLIKNTLQSDSSEMGTLAGDIYMDFVIENPEITSYLKAQWETVYDGETIQAEFLDNGLSKVKLVRPLMTLSAMGKYSIQDGYMLMNIDSKTLYGKIEYLSANEFKITTNSGKIATFVKM